MFDPAVDSAAATVRARASPLHEYREKQYFFNEKEYGILRAIVQIDRINLL